ncbi:unnamed protein product [Sphagnum jensenii]|uniref:Uncharacterized protein n=1 Tax=Sphagnum jensenii TaxID=128206 RepID=A0ABP0X621_9BRYO
MKGKYGAFGGGATLEKSKLDLSQSTSRVSPQLEAGGGGGNIGNKNFNGGGDGGDDDGDDDDYFGEDGDDDGGDDGGFFGRRLALPEVFDRKIVAAVLQEWFKTMNDLPAGIRQAVELGLISSGQMVRFLSVNARPTVSRAISRIVPPSVSRAFIGRLLADPAFLYKLTLEQGFTIGYGIWWECQHRGDRIRQEWDVAAANVLTLAVCNAAICWSLAPSRSYGSTFKYEFQNTIQKLPNNVFDKSYPLREFDLQKRIYSFFYKAAELSLVGMVTGAAGAGLARVMPSSRNQLQTSVPIPSVSTSALSHGAFLGISGNLRYQLLNGAERVMQQHFNHLGVVLFFSTSLRVLNIQIGDVTRLTWLGLGELATVTPDGLQKAYHRPTLSSDSIPGWFIPTRGLISGFFEGNKNQGKEGRQHQTPKMLGKRKVKRKVTAGR